jgi:hypothetical protein
MTMIDAKVVRGEGLELRFTPYEGAVLVDAVSAAAEVGPLTRSLELDATTAATLGRALLKMSRAGK